MQSKILVVGTGRAGQARLKAVSAHAALVPLSLSARDPHFSKKFAQSLDDDDVNAVVVCTSNETHFEIAHAALSARKHTLVEFPLCRTAREAAILYGLAKRMQRVLHVEFIGLMTGAHRALAMVDATEIGRIRVDMSGGYYRWVRSDAESGYIGSLLVGRLQALHHLVGPMKLLELRCEQSTVGYDLTIRLEGRGSIPIDLRDRRSQHAERIRVMEVFDHAGAPITPSLNPLGGGLFEADLNLFLSSIHHPDATTLLVEEADVLEVMRLADLISEQCKATSPILQS